MKAVCIRFSFELSVIGIDVCAKVDYNNLDDKEFKIIAENGKSANITRQWFFYLFKVIGGNDIMAYSDFEYILCNMAFPMAVLFPNEYSGIRHLIIQDIDGCVIMITVNKLGDNIRISFPGIQKECKSYEDALDKIMLWKKVTSKF